MQKPLLEREPEFKLKSMLFFERQVRGILSTGGLRTKGFFKKKYRDKTVISVVTVVYNGDKYLEQTIKSVLNQNYDNVEYIIIDGGSTDNTLDIIKKYDYAIDYWISEPDGGIYNAMNKGASLCSGDYVAFLNADDWYVEGIINRVSLGIGNGDIDYAFGNVNIYGGVNGSRIFRPQLSEYKYKMPLPHPSFFLRRSLLLMFGFNEGYRAIADYDLILKILGMNLKSKYIDEVFVNFRAGGLSSFPHEREHFRLAYEHFGLLIALNKWRIKKKERYKGFPKKVFKKLARMF